MQRKEVLKIPQVQARRQTNKDLQTNNRDKEFMNWNEYKVEKKKKIIIL